LSLKTKFPINSPIHSINLINYLPIFAIFQFKITSMRILQSLAFVL
jgi:hypothetical protein